MPALARARFFVGNVSPTHLGRNGSRRANQSGNTAGEGEPSASLETTPLPPPTLRLGLLVLACAWLGGCSADSHPPMLQDFGEGREGGVAVAPPRQPRCANDAGPAAPNTEGLCGNAFLSVTANPPNIYFVIDRSGSMHEWVDGQEKYTAVANASVRLVQSLGPKVSVGAAVFPGPKVSLANACLAGEEVFPTTPGQPTPAGSCDDENPVALAFARAINLPAGTIPVGSTPTAATLNALLPTLVSLPGETSVILATDGGPNCNSAAHCKVDQCIPNIEKACYATNACCDARTNCCDPELGGPESCLDSEPTQRAVASLLEHGIKTYVVGTPGSSPYAALLDQLALAGGTARSGSTSYYDVKHVSELDDVLAAIRRKHSVILGCHLRLEAPPPDPALVNIYLDRELLTFGSTDRGIGPRARLKTRAGLTWGRLTRASATKAQARRLTTRTRVSKMTQTR